MTPENVLIVDQVSRLPTFCTFSFKEDDPSTVTWIDFWAVEPCNDSEIDYARGHRYADEAIWHVRATAQPVFVECVLIFMAIKLREENRCAGALENGFIDRIASEFPGAMDKALSRVLRLHPRKLNLMHKAIQRQNKSVMNRPQPSFIGAENHGTLTNQLD